MRCRWGLFSTVRWANNPMAAGTLWPGVDKVVEEWLIPEMWSVHQSDRQNEGHLQP